MTAFGAGWSIGGASREPYDGLVSSIFACRPSGILLADCTNAVLLPVAVLDLLPGGVSRDRLLSNEKSKSSKLANEWCVGLLLAPLLGEDGAEKVRFNGGAGDVLLGGVDGPALPIGLSGITIFLSTSNLASLGGDVDNGDLGDMLPGAEPLAVGLQGATSNRS